MESIRIESEKLYFHFISLTHDYTYEVADFARITWIMPKIHLFVVVERS